MDRTGPGIATAAPEADTRLADARPPSAVIGRSRIDDQRADPSRTDMVGARFRQTPVYAALDLGTNNCRLLIARQPAQGCDLGAFRVLDSFCRIVRLGEGVATTGRLSDAAMVRTIAALKVCREKMHHRHVTRTRLIATEACRAADNSREFLDRVYDATGLVLEIVDRETEALLATTGCASLADPEAAGVVLFDIGGGSSEIVWLGDKRPRDWRRERYVDDPMRARVRAWDSMKVGVVTLAERYGGRMVTPDIFEAMVADVRRTLAPFVEQVAGLPRDDRFHLLGTSGTVTTIAGVHLGLPRYDRRRVDGLWMSSEAIAGTIAELRGMSFEDRSLNGCIGPDRADLVLAGCAIFEAIRRAFPCERVRIADRGLREGILMQMMGSDRIWSQDGF